MTVTSLSRGGSTWASVKGIYRESKRGFSFAYCEREQVHLLPWIVPLD